MNVYLPNKRLPSAYQEVEYIQSSSGEYINTGIVPNQKTIVETKFNITQFIGNYPRIYGAIQGTRGTNQYAFELQYVKPDESKLKALNYFNSSSNTYNINSISNISLNTDYTTKHTNTQFYLNGVLQGTVNATNYSLSYPMYIFQTNSQGSPLGRNIGCKLYWLKIYSGTTLQRDFVPCYRKSDSVIGLYDLVNNQFYTNSGSGTFSKGSDVTMTELKNAYIGNGLS